MNKIYLLFYNFYKLESGIIIFHLYYLFLGFSAIFLYCVFGWRLQIRPCGGVLPIKSSQVQQSADISVLTRFSSPLMSTIYHRERSQTRPGVVSGGRRIHDMPLHQHSRHLGLQTTGDCSQRAGDCNQTPVGDNRQR